MGGGVRQCGSGKPHVVILGGVHGNELTGIEEHCALFYPRLKGDETRLTVICFAGKVVGNLLDGPAVKKGTLTLALGNPAAIERGTRGSSDHADLNRAFSRASLLAAPDEDSPESTRARLLAPLLSDCDVCIDLHATNKPSVPFLRIAGELQPRHTEVMRWLRAQVLLADPDHKLAGEPVTTDEYVGSQGGIGICFETGHAADVSLVGDVTRSMQTLLAIEMGMLQAPEEVIEAELPQETYEMREVFKLTERGFAWAEGVGSKNFDFIPARKPIGFVDGEPFAVGYDSYLIFPKVKALWRVGGPLGWLAAKKTAAPRAAL